MQKGSVMKIWIENVRVYRGLEGFRPGRVLIEGDRIAQVDTEGGMSGQEKPEAERLGKQKPDIGMPDGSETFLRRIDGAGKYLIPGLVDCHLHGAGGYDLGMATEAALKGIADYELSCGVTTICPTVMTSDTDTYRRTAALIRKWEDDTVAGFRTEGPFLAPTRCGSQKAEYFRLPDIGWYEELQEWSGHRLRILDIAPELPGAAELITHISGGEDCIASIAHTDASYEAARQAIAAGAVHATHLHNAMPAYHHREPGVAGAVYDSDTCVAELITDGIHLHPAVVRNAYRLLGAERIVLVSDSMMATGTDAVTASLGEQKVLIHGRRACLADGTIAASVSNLAECVRTAIVDMNIAPAEAIYSATATPAAALGMAGRVGRIAPGFAADLALMNEDWTVDWVMKRGKSVT